jgi:hypothetical protein
MTKYIQTQEELLGHLKDQVAFMKQSAASYDNGFEDEAKRLAVIIRVLVHDTSNSRSLLTLLNRKNIKLYDSSIPYHPENLLSHNGLVMIKMSTNEGASYVAPLDDGPPIRSRTKKIPFNMWWENMFVIKDKNGETFTRKDLVLNTANKDGGAHIDPSLDEAYANLSRFNSIGWKVFRNDIEDSFRNSPVSASVRQIAHEVLKTLKDEFPELF